MFVLHGRAYTVHSQATLIVTFSKPKTFGLAKRTVPRSTNQTLLPSVLSNINKS